MPRQSQISGSPSLCSTIYIRIGGCEDEGLVQQILDIILKLAVVRIQRPSNLI